MSLVVSPPACSMRPLPAPIAPIVVRPGTLDDVPFLDSLQKLHTRQVGWMPTAQFEGKIKLGHVLIAEDETNQPVGYCIGTDQYFKRDDLGIIYQMNVVPGKQRGLIGATLLKAMFDRAAYGCKLFCCWCAQDIAANRFWEAMGFVPLAFRSGSAQKARVHIFWQRRIRTGDVTTPWWFPSQTSSGSIREDRIVLPIPPGTHWSDAKPMLLPTADVPGAEAVEEPRRVLGERKPREQKLKDAPVHKPSAITAGGLRFAAPAPPKSDAVKPRREAKQKVKNDPRFVAAARELRDRWLERVNGEGVALGSGGKYDVSRVIDTTVTIEVGDARPLLIESAKLLAA